MDENGENFDNMEPVFQRRQAVRRKGFVWQKTQSLAQIAEDHRRGVTQRPTKIKQDRVRHRCSSLDLAPSLLSIYDSIALATKTTEDEGGTDQSETSVNSQTKENPTPTNSPTNQQPSQAPSIRIDVDRPKCDLNHSRMCEVAGTNNNDDDNDSKKRPLSISSMSSSSSSSLPRHSHKRPNLSQFDPVTLGRSDMEKLDSLLFIDDDAPSGNTDEEMSVDTDGESGRKCDKDGASIQSSASLSSTETNDNQEKSSTLSHDHNIVGTTGNTNDTLSTASNYGDSCHGDQNNNSQASISFSSPAYRSFTSNENRVLSVSSPHNVSVGKSSSTTPLSRHSSVSRDGTSPTKYVTYVQRVVAEIVETERIYVRYLKEIIDGYLEFLGRSSELRISEKERACLFGNILEIYEFSRGFLEDLEQCEDDPLKVAACFVKNNEGFSIYAEYCTNYPKKYKDKNQTWVIDALEFVHLIAYLEYGTLPTFQGPVTFAIKVLTGVMMHPELSEVIKQQQITLGHNLPLGAYLLKPVQRVLKYHLLLHNLLKNYNKKDPGHEILSQALEHMTGMAQHINEMKRKHEHAVRVQEIQSQLEEYDGEDLTRLGELVLEGSFRIYGAKTSRHVFLFEKGILIAKRKEDSMLSSKGFILCSNLMLVESIPKEPLSFQIIPFDNPRGQHMLQARNLDQKRKWCQEVKRLILESYKGMIPENVKGLVMQLGKSKEEETAKPADLEPKKFHYHNVPEYLEKRHRLRRKSGGTLIADILKPQRRKNRRGESVSPRGSPTMERKQYGTSAAENTPTSKDVENDRSTISRETTASDIASLTSVDNDVDGVDEVPGVNVNQSFDSAVRGQSLLSCGYDVEETDLNEIAKNPDKVTRRTRSFRMATRLRPLRSVDLGDERISNSSPNTPCDSKDIDFQQHASASMDTQVSTLPDTRHDQNGYSAHEQCNNLSDNQHNGRLSRSDTYSSMPALSQTDKDFESSVNEGRDMETRSSSSSSSSSHRPSNESFKSLGNFQQSKRIIDAKQYFTRDKSATNSTESFDSSCNLRRDNNSVSALNDSFVKKSLENVGQNSPMLGPRSPKLSLSKPLPLTSSLEKTLAVKSLVRDQSKVCSDSACDISDTRNMNMCFSYPEVSEANPWVLNCSGADVYKKSLTKRQRSHSTDCDLDDTTRENLNMDWIVYANRNSLPVTGFSTDDIPKLYKYCTPPREEMDKFKTMDDNVFRDKPPNLPHQNLIKSFATPPRSSMHPANMQKYSSEVRYSLPTAMSSGESESDKSSTIGSLPTFVKKSTHIQDKHSALTRSNSTPCARVGHALLSEFRSVRTMSEDMDNIIIDHEKIVAEMEDYMKKSDSNLTLNTSNSKFPTNFQVITSDDEADNKRNRDSVASNYSSSSYESQESFESPHNDSIVDTLKSKISDFKNKITHRRSGSYDNKHNFNSGQVNESDGENHVRHESRSSLLSLNSWFSQNSKEKEEPDLHSILHAGELGGTGIGQRMADPEPVYGELGFTHPLNKHREQHRTSCTSSVDDDPPSPDASLKPSDDSSTTQLPTLQNLNIQQCDSAFSIGDSCNLDDSPRTNSEKGKCERRGSNSSSGSFYERRLSMAFEDGEAFRDSAVYCEMDVDHQDIVSPSHETFSPRYQQRLPIKAYIQKLEESTKPKKSLPSKVTAREPSPMVKMKMVSLQNSAVYKRSNSRPASEERELRACLNRSRPVSEERELPSVTRQKEKDLSPLLAHLKGRETSPKIFGSERNLSSPRSSKEREISPFSSRSKFLRSSTPCREDRPLRREQSDVGYYRSRSSTPVSGEIKSSKSLNRLDQIGNDVESLVIMKGWVRQLIQKFQPTSS